MLERIVNLNYVKEGINSNLVENMEVTEKVVSEVKNSVKDNLVAVKMNTYGLEGVIEVSLHKGTETKQYLLEARLFDENDGMVNAYLEVINEDLTKHDEYIDDVWTYDDWKAI